MRAAPQHPRLAVTPKVTGARYASWAAVHGVTTVGNKMYVSSGLTLLASDATGNSTDLYPSGAPEWGNAGMLTTFEGKIYMLCDGTLYAVDPKDEPSPFVHSVTAPAYGQNTCSGPDTDFTKGSTSGLGNVFNALPGGVTIDSFMDEAGLLGQKRGSVTVLTRKGTVTILPLIHAL